MAKIMALAAKIAALLVAGMATSLAAAISA